MSFTNLKAVVDENLIDEKKEEKKDKKDKKGKKEEKKELKKEDKKMNNYKEKEFKTDKIDDLKNKIKNLEDELNLVKNENNRLKIIEKDFNDLKQNYKNEIQKLKSINNELNNKIESYKKGVKSDKNKNDDKIIELMEEIRMKDKELNELKSKLSVDLKKDEKLMTIIFLSADENIHYSLICKNTDRFNRIEKLLYDKYPEYKYSKNYFTANGSRVNKSKTMEENNIKFSDIILLKKYGK